MPTNRFHTMHAYMPFALLKLRKSEAKFGSKLLQQYFAILNGARYAWLLRALASRLAFNAAEVSPRAGT